MKAFLDRPLEGDWPDLWIAATPAFARAGPNGQRCRVHFQRNALAHAGKSGRRVVSACTATAFAQNTAEAASTRWRAAPRTEG